MENNKNIYAALCELQSQLRTVEKTKQAYNFKYADLSAIWDMMRKPLHDNGFSIIQLVNTEDGRNYVITKLIHVSGECIESKTLIEFKANKFQEVGAAITYYRRYALSAMLGIVSDEDVDDKIEKESEIYKKEEPKLNGAQVLALELALEGKPSIVAQIKNRYGSIAGVKVAEYAKVLDYAKAQPIEVTNEN